MIEHNIDHCLLEKLYELLEQDQFELLMPLDEGKIRLVYLMNDAVESFLVFEDAVLTGMYDPEYEGVEDAEVRQEEDGRYVLIAHQGKTVCTIFFRDLSLEVYTFNYGKLGHTWMKGAEDLRQMEYWIAIMHDKREYLGSAYCSSLEEELACLEAFPPLNCCSYPAVPRKYFEPRKDAWVPSEEAIERMQNIAEEAKDQRLVSALKLYKKFHGRIITKNIARMFRKNAHSRVTELLYHKILEATKEFPDRVFEKEEEIRFQEIRNKAEKRRKTLVSSGKRVMEFSQVPFMIAKDEVEYKVHLLVVEKGLLHRRIRVETFE